MIEDIKEIKSIRKKLSLTQFELAKRANVSQSLIAKIEAGMIDPTYTNAKKIFAALEDLGRKKELKATDLMSDKVSSIKPDHLIKEAIVIMKKNGFSQLPVIKDEKVVGMISETDILEAILEKRGKTIDEIMESAPPTISFDTPVSVISNLLKYFQMVIVTKKEKIMGVITKTDLLAKMYGKE